MRTAHALLLAGALAKACAAPAYDPWADSPVGPAAERHAYEVLAPLVEARGVSGDEGPVREAVRQALSTIDPSWQPTVDEAGNLLLTLGRGERTLLFVAHLDEIGLVVTALREDGRLEASKRGGFHDHLYQATAIELVTARGVLPGIVLPASDDEEAPYVLDVGAGSAEEARRWGVAEGDLATVPKELVRLGAHRAAGRSNDDRVGCAALLLALERLDVAALDRTVVFAWVTREEIGLEGADHLARTLRPVPEVAFAVDTMVSSDSPRDDPRYAFTPLGAGPVLRALDSSSYTPRPVRDRLAAIAARHGLPLQVGTVGGGNDGSRFLPQGATDAPLSWPQRNSHSRVETFDLRDLVGLARLVAVVAAEY